MTEVVLLRVERSGQRYILVDQDGREVSGVLSLRVSGEVGGLARIEAEFLAHTPEGKQIK